jgi:FkbM family methyltransferase
MNESLALLLAAVRPGRRAKYLRAALRNGGALGAVDFIALGFRFGVSTIECDYLDRYRIRIALAGRSITQGILETGAFQNDLFAFFARHVPDRSLRFVNVGANVGTTCLNAHHAGFRKFTAFEPVAANFALLQENLAQIAQDGAVEAFAFGLGERAEQREIFLDPASTGRHSMVRNVGRGAETVSVRRLDDVAPREPSVLWIDAEGFEAEILRGGEAFLAECCRGLCMEVTPELLGRAKLEYLEAATRRHFSRCLTQDGAVATRLGEIAEVAAGRQTDVIFLP